MSKPQVFCDPELPKDWSDRELLRERERLLELALREPQLVEPELVDMFRLVGAV